MRARMGARRIGSRLCPSQRLIYLRVHGGGVPVPTPTIGGSRLSEGPSALDSEGFDAAKVCASGWGLDGEHRSPT